MAEFYADVRDVKFVLFEQARIDKLFSYGRYQDLDRDTVEAMIDEAYKFAKNQMAPMNDASDREGAVYDPATSEVKVPQAFHDTWKLFRESGFVGISHSPEWGGMGMPYTLHLAMNDFFFGACLAFSLDTLLTTGAAHLVDAFGSDALKKTYLEKMYNGEWAGTMCLTESGAGSDVGALRTKARKEGDHYLIEGEKIFITFGEHDITPNIVHAVLARIEGAPAGTKGISLFLVPKYLVGADGSLGERNDVRASGVEHKMGIHASPTCTMQFGESGRCVGYLLGEENKGMRAMFQMMNEARISVGLQGAALANAAYQYALNYAKERIQSKDIMSRDEAGVPIVRHPDVRQMLMQQKAISEGTRALLLRTAFFYDAAEASDDPAERERYLGLVELLTPICKAYASDQGFRSTELSMQTMGGYGYLKEYPVEQYMRDTKIASIYEGTNGIQALDLVGRKLPAKGGANFQSLIGMMMEFGAEHAEHPILGNEMGLLGKAIEAIVDVTTHFAMTGQKDPTGPILDATPYLDLFGQLVVGWLLLEQGTIAWPAFEAICKDKGVDPADRKAVAALCAENDEARFYHDKMKVAQFWARRSLPLVPAKAAVVKSSDRSPLEAIF